MAMYLCRWPNGEFSIVNASNKEDAIVLLDEWGNAEQSDLRRMPDCLFDFRRGDDGEIELADIGEASYEFIMRNCYPELNKVLSSDGPEDALASVRSAVQRERTRLWDSQPNSKAAETELGRDIQRQTGAASVLVDRIVRRAATKRLKAMKGTGKKPN